MATTKKSYKQGIDRIVLADQLDKYRPQNMPIDMFQQSPDLEYIGGPFSTFDVHLSQMLHDGVNTANIEDYIIEHMPNFNNVVIQYVRDLLDISDQFSEICTHIRENIRHAPLKTLNKFFDTLTQEMNQRMGITDQKIITSVIDSWDMLPPAPRDADQILGQCRCIRINQELVTLLIIHRGNLAALTSPQIQDSLYIAMIMTFMHEFSHYVDFAAPNRGTLGAQIASMDNTPIQEYSAHTIGASIRDTMLAHRGKE